MKNDLIHENLQTMADATEFQRLTLTNALNADKSKQDKVEPGDVTGSDSDANRSSEHSNTYGAEELRKKTAEIIGQSCDVSQQSKGEQLTASSAKTKQEDEFVRNVQEIHVKDMTLYPCTGMSFNICISN